MKMEFDLPGASILAAGFGPDIISPMRSAQFDRPGWIQKLKSDRDGSHQKDLERVRRFQEAAWAATVGLL